MQCINCTNETNNPKFCSRSCSAIYNNTLNPKRKPEGQCKICKRPTKTIKSYCSKPCRILGLKVSNQQRSQALKSYHANKFIVTDQDRLCVCCGQPIITNKNIKLCSKACSQIYPTIQFAQQAELSGLFYNYPYSGSSHAVRKYLINKHGNACMICKQSGDNWHGQPITLIVDHINGHADDWKIDNIQLVCPNCDSQLPTYKGRNKGNCTRSYTITQK